MKISAKLAIFVFICSGNCLANILPEFDSDAIRVGIFDPNNVVIHVGQNLVNFLSSSLAWFVLLQFPDLSKVKPKEEEKEAKDMMEPQQEAGRYMNVKEPAARYGAKRRWRHPRRSSPRVYDRPIPIQYVSKVLRLIADASDRMSKFMDAL
ncbi:uncharacterized protein LOC131885023 [Tigriopus californicus]|uniref:uncharacterized protein LOC131885023 n=1 Tax=Tigriopus californicus TaxID=6832 RepID=UPI0027DA2967|nr:uncharacterized protein LOC131885023 [Tigriopus californicus]